jgi:hypothetical protein
VPLRGCVSPAFRLSASEEVSKGNYAKAKPKHSHPDVRNNRVHRYWSHAYISYYCRGSSPRYAEHAWDENAKAQTEGQAQDRAQKEGSGSKKEATSKETSNG